MKKLCLYSAFALSFAAHVLAEPLPPLPEGVVTLAVIPDTQRYEGEGKRVAPGKPAATGPVRNKTFDACVDWILAHRASERIFFVSHTGDITDNRNDLQFAFAAKEMAKFDGKLPYGISPGNHDLNVSTSDLFCKYFPASKFEKEPWYAGHFGGYTNQAGQVVCRDNADSCQLVEAGGMKFVILHVECNAPDPVLAWVDAQLDKYADRKAIISTHQDLGFLKKEYQDAWNKGGAVIANQAQSRLDAGKKIKETPPHPDRAQLGRLRWKKCHGKEGNTPQQAWEKCYSKHGNVVLILSGDQGPVNVVRDISTGVSGNRVFAAMHDNQTHSIRLYRFYPNLEKIEVWSVNPMTGELLTSYKGWTDRDDHDFTWKVEH